MDGDLQTRLFHALVGKPLVGNAFRGTLVEAMLSRVLEPEWRWCADGWGSFDFERADGLGLEVKQSAALQNWHLAGDNPNRGRFDIASRTGRWEGAKWIAEPGRAAAIYVFAWHPETDFDVADHRDPAQWVFHVVPASALPEQKSIALSGIERLAKCVAIDEVAAAVRKF